MKRKASYNSRHLGERALLYLIVLIIFFVGMSVEAQTLVKPGPRQGYYLGLGAEAIADNIYTDDLKWTGPHLGPYGSIHVGQGIVESLALGLHFGAGAAYSSGRQLILGNVSIEAKWSFFGNLFIRPSIGFGFVDVTRRKSGLAKIYSDIGGRYHLAVGHDFFPFHKPGKTGGVAVSPFVFASYSNATELHSMTGGIGLEITYWTGLPKNQLALDGDEAFR